MLRHWSVAAILVSPAVCVAGDASATLEKTGVAFRVGQTTVARYSTETRYSKPFLYPVLAPGEVPVTRGYPIEKATPGGSNDHPHHKSVWFCHGEVIPEGLVLKIKTSDQAGHGVDFWSEATDRDGTKRYGQIRCVKVSEPRQISPEHVAVETENEWISPDGVKILDEVRVIHFHNRPEGRLFSFAITLRASVCPIRFGDTKEGSYGVRVHDALRPTEKSGAIVMCADGRMIEPPARDNLAIWGYPSSWVDYSGQVDGQGVGIAVFDHPDNPRANWHARAYGLVAANPFGREVSGFPSQKGKSELIKIEKGGELKLHYGVYAHSGDARTGKVVAAYDAFRSEK